MTEVRLARRDFLTSAVTTLGAAAGLPLAGCASVARRSPPEPVRLGVASYSLRKLSREEAIGAIRALGTPYVNVKSVHLAYDLPPARLAAGRRQFEAAGLEIVGGGTIYFEEDTDAEVRRYFEYAKHAGMPLIVVACAPGVLPRVERFAKGYDIRVAIHNHGPEDEFFPSPYDALRYIRNMDPRMGLCVDVGHTVRTGDDVVKAIADAGPRVLDLHLKDYRDLTDKNTQCVVGEGAMPIAEIFQQLRAMRYRGYANLEYEIDAENPLPGMRQSFGHMRGVLAGLAAERRGGRWR